MIRENPKAHLGRYELVAKIASGGMGEIFLARLEGAAGFEKLYVVKRVLPHLAGDVRFRTMLIDEARIASKLSHPNICQVYELGETDGELYIVMEYLEGVTLLPLLRHASQHGRPLDLGMIAYIIQQISDALHHAHELRDRDGTILNIVHRDVTPSNIFLTESGVAKVLDFGIAKAKNVSTNTQTGTIKGKHAYMAPEQLRGAQLDRRVDVFAVGVLLFEILALRRLFQRRTDYLTLQAVMEQPIPDVRAFRADIPDALVAALARALCRDRDQRFETVRQLGTAVVEAISAQHRVWTASNLGDELAVRFADDLRRRGAAVLAAVSRSAELTSRTSVPLLAELMAPGAPADASGDGQTSAGALNEDLDLPTMESAMLLAAEQPHPTRVERTTERTAERTIERADASIPPRFAALATADTAAAAAAPYLIPEPPPPARRSWWWTVFAVALLGIAGAALFLVWRNGQRQQTVLVVTKSAGGAGGELGAGSPTERAGLQPNQLPSGDPGGLAPELTAADAGVPDAPPARPGRPGRPNGSDEPTPRDPKAILRAKIAALQPQMARCLGQHPAPAALEGTVVLKIDPHGKVASVEITPRAIAETALATCIKATFTGRRFPEPHETLEIKVPFSTKLRPDL